MLDILKTFDSANGGKLAPVKVESGGMLDILKKFDLVESSTTESLDKDQKSVNQLSAEFKPKTVKVLGTKTDPKNPMGGKLVGGCEESVESGVAEDLVSKVKRSLDDYLKSAEENRRPDRDIIKKTKIDRDLGKRPMNDFEIVAKVKPVKQIEIPECSFPVKTFALEDGNLCEVHGDEFKGFEIRRGNRCLPSKFNTLDEAMLALELYNARNAHHQKIADESQDYIEEN